ncbi:MAG: FCD domain-containing protein, partial [Variovorax sp.]
DLTQARIRIEAAIIELAVERGDADWEAGMIASFHALSRTPLPVRPDDTEAIALWEARHRAFHRAIASGCASNWLLRIQAQLSDHTERYRRVRTFHFATPAQVARDVEREHRDLLDALLARKAPRASDLMRAHLEHTARAVSALWEQGRKAGAARKAVRRQPRAA